MRPGTNVTIQNQLPPTTPPISTGTWFIAGVTTQGPVAPQAANSLAEWQAIYGARGTNPLMSDSVETYFNEGGTQVITARVVGPAATIATVTLKDASNNNSVTINAAGPGVYANGYQIVVTAVSGGYTITVEDSHSNILEVSNTLVTVADAVAYGATSSFVDVVVAGVNPPAAGTATLAGGVDDLADITTTQYVNALALFNWSYGPGQVSVPGVTTTAVQTAIANHCATGGYAPGFRVGVVDMPDTNVASTLVGDVAPLTALGSQARYVFPFTPWMDIAPVAGTSSVRAVPPSAFYAGQAARSDAQSATPLLPGGNPNLPVAGFNGVIQSAVDAHAFFVSADRTTLNTAGINVIRTMSNGFRIYGNVTAVNRITDPLYYQASNVRLDMAILADCQEIQEEFEFTQIDGQGVDASDYGNDIVALLTNYFTAGAIFAPDGTEATAFAVDTSSDVNTPTTESEGELLATIAYSRSPGAEQVNLNIVRVSAAVGV